MIFFLIFRMVLGLSNQLHMFSQLYLIELLGFLTGLGLLNLWNLKYARLFRGFGMLVFFTNFKSHGISGQIFDPISSYMTDARLTMIRKEVCWVTCFIIKTVLLDNPPPPSPHPHKLFFHKFHDYLRFAFVSQET